MLKQFKLTAIIGLLIFLTVEQAYAHCDGLGGPVVTAGKKALETKDLNPVLIWVPKKDETEVKEAFKKTLAVRKLDSLEARELADQYFFETIIRIHRAGEGVAFTGLKPADRDLGPAIPTADKAIVDGSPKQVLSLLSDVTRRGLEEHFADVMKKRNFKKEDIEAGRDYIEAYVTYIHYVERLYDAAEGKVKGHYLKPEED